MPKYDYRCSACGLVYEKREGFDAPSLQECPECNGQARRVLTPPAIVFKGSGWYVTDHRKGSAGTDSDSSAKSEKTDKAETKSETKSESKADTKSSSSTPAPSTAAAD